MFRLLTLLSALALSLSCSGLPSGGIPFRGQQFANALLEFDTPMYGERTARLEGALGEIEGVVYVQLDTEFQFARIFYGEPVTIDLEAIERSAGEAGFGLHAIRLTVPGVVVSAPGTSEGVARFLLRVDGTDQLFELAGEEHAAGEELEVEAEVLGWEDGRPRLRLPTPLMSL